MGPEIYSLIRNSVFMLYCITLHQVLSLLLLSLLFSPSSPFSLPSLSSLFLSSSPSFFFSLLLSPLLSSSLSLDKIRSSVSDFFFFLPHHHSVSYYPKLSHSSPSSALPVAQLVFIHWPHSATDYLASICHCSSEWGLQIARGFWLPLADTPFQK